jgi:hypothetical protein
VFPYELNSFIRMLQTDVSGLYEGQAKLLSYRLGHLGQGTILRNAMEASLGIFRHLPRFDEIHARYRLPDRAVQGDRRLLLAAWLQSAPLGQNENTVGESVDNSQGACLTQSTRQAGNQIEPPKVSPNFITGFTQPGS